MQVKEMMDLPTEAQKQARAEEIIRIHFVQMEANAEAGVPKELLELMKIEVDGGDCPQCGKPWKEVVYDNLFGKGRYFKSVCHCYPMCWNCGYQNYRQDIMGALEKTVKTGRHIINKKIKYIPRSRVTACANCGRIMKILETLPDEEEQQINGYNKQYKGKKKAELRKRREE